MPWLNPIEIASMGFASVAVDALLSSKASYYNCQGISIGSQTRIDDFAIISAGERGITIGSNVHIAAFCFLGGRGRIELADFSNLSSRVSVYSSTDDYSGATMTNPTLPSQYTGVQSADVLIGKHVIVGCGSVILPGARLERGVAIGALSLVAGLCEEFSIYAGVPAKFKKNRSRALERLEIEYLRDR